MSDIATDSRREVVVGTVLGASLLTAAITHIFVDRPLDTRIETRGTQQTLLLDGQSLAIADGPGGSVENISFQQNQGKVTGWAIDPSRECAATRIIVFNGDKSIQGEPALPRPDIRALFDNGCALPSGFSIDIPGDWRGKPLRVFSKTRDDTVIEIALPQ